MNKLTSDMLFFFHTFFLNKNVKGRLFLFILLLVPLQACLEVLVIFLLSVVLSFNQSFDFLLQISSKLNISVPILTIISALVLFYFRDLNYRLLYNISRKYIADIQTLFLKNLFKFPDFLFSNEAEINKNEVNFNKKLFNFFNHELFTLYRDVCIPFLKSTINIIVLVMILISAIKISPYIFTPLFLLLILFNTLLIKSKSSFLKRNSLEFISNQSKSSSYLSYLFTSPFLYNFAGFTKTYNRSASDSYSKQLKSHFNLSLPVFLIRFRIELALVILISLVIIYVKFINFDINSFNLLFGLVSLQRAITGSQSIFNSISTLLANSTSLRNFSESYKEIRSINNAICEKIFSFDKKNNYEFKNINLLIPKNIRLFHKNYEVESIDSKKPIHLEGKSGIGKTTFLKRLVTSSYQINSHSNSISISPKVDNNGDFSKIRSVCLFLPQVAPLPPLTFNQLFLDYDHKKVFHFLRECGFKKNTLNNLNYKTSIKNDPKNLLNDLNLSGGEAQRLWLAYFTLSKFPILIMDEPFSALDKKSFDVSVSTVLKYKNPNTIILCTSHIDLPSDFKKYEMKLLE